MWAIEAQGAADALVVSVSDTWSSPQPVSASRKLCSEQFPHIGSTCRVVLIQGTSHRGFNHRCTQDGVLMADIVPLISGGLSGKA